jgi:hypothetical protein
MSETPKTSIHWARKFTFPVALPLDESDMLALGLSFDNYFSGCGVAASTILDLERGFGNGIITGTSIVVPGQSNVSSIADAALADGAITALLGKKFPADGSLFNADSAVIASTYYASVLPSFENKQASLLPLPLDAATGLHITWPLDTAAINATLGETVGGIDAEGAVSGFSYGLQTSPTVEGELDPLLVRSMMMGMGRFERYQHIQKAGDGSLVGVQKSNTGRLLITDPDVLALTFETVEGRVGKTITGVSYEHLDCTYSFSSPGVITQHPAIAVAYLNILTAHLSLFGSYVLFQETSASGGDTSTFGEKDKASGVMLELIATTLVRVLRTWVAWRAFVTGAEALGSLSAAHQALLKSTSIIDKEQLSGMLGAMVLDHAVSSTGSSWSDLRDFLQNVYVPLFLGCTWMELGTDLSKLPAFSDNIAGWWTIEANAWGKPSIGMLELPFLFQIPVWAGAAIGYPASYFKSNTAAEATQLTSRAGLTVFDLEAITLAGKSADVGLGGVVAPTALHDRVDMTAYTSLEIGFHITLRPYQINNTGGVTALLTVPYENLFGELLEDTGMGAVIQITDNYAHHPLISDALASLAQTHHVMARRDDGETILISSGSLLEVKISINFATTEDYIVGEVLANLDKVFLKFTLKNGSTELPYMQLLDIDKNIDFGDPNFQSKRFVTGEIQPLKMGWREGEQVEFFLTQNAFDYEGRMLVIQNDDAKLASFYFWFLAPKETASGAASLDIKVQLFFDTDELVSFEPTDIAFDNTVAVDGVFPAVFQEAPDEALIFDIKTGSVFNQSEGKTGAGGAYEAQAKYLSQFVWELDASDAEAGHDLFVKFRDTLPSGAAIKASLQSEASTTGQVMTAKVYTNPYWKLKESYTSGALSNGLYDFLLPAYVHDRFRIAQNVFDTQVRELTELSIPITNALPINTTLALWVIESGLNLAPSLPMLRLGIPPVAHSPENTIVFKSGDNDHNNTVHDLIYCSTGSAFLSFSESEYLSLTKDQMKLLKADASIWYILNLLSMDAYVGGFSTVSNETFYRQQKHGFVKSVLYTRRQIGMLNRTGTAASDIDVIRSGYQRWYEMTGNLSIGWGFVPQHKTQMGFGAAKDGTKLQELWIHESTLHFATCLRGKMLTGYQPSQDLPNVIAYVRFNFGERRFLGRIFNILHNTWKYAKREFARSGHGEIMTSAHYTTAIQNFLLDLGANHFGVAAATATAFDAPTVVTIRGLTDLTEVRRADTTDIIGDENDSIFDTLEKKLLSREFDQTDAELYVTTLLQGDTETDMVSHYESNSADLNVMLNWMEADATRWPALGDFFSTKEGKFVVYNSSSATITSPSEIDNKILEPYEKARWLQIRINAFNLIFA